MSIDEQNKLFDKWNALNQTNCSKLGATQQRAIDRLEILESLEQAGINEIRGEAIPVRFLIRNARKVLRETQALTDRLS